MLPCLGFPGPAPRSLPLCMPLTPRHWRNCKVIESMPSAVSSWIKSLQEVAKREDSWNIIPLGWPCSFYNLWRGCEPVWFCLAVGIWPASCRLPTLGLKSLIYKTILRPAALYGVECWPTTKTTEKTTCDGNKNDVMDPWFCTLGPNQEYIETTTGNYSHYREDAGTQTTLVRTRTAHEPIHSCQLDL